jgi:3-hydroxyacyl-CoA dehydrogenase
MGEQVTVIGAGTMGHGIAEVAAIGGYNVTLVDMSDQYLAPAMEKVRWSLNKLSEKGKLKGDVASVLGRMRTSTSIEDSVKNADYVIEAIPEKMQLKKDTFAKLDKFAPREAILATNTSTLPPTEIAQATRYPERVVAMHFFNPPPLMRLVEIIRGDKTSEATMRKTDKLAQGFGKETVLVQKDIPGFATSRLLGRIWDTGFWWVYKGKSSVVEFDAAARYRLGFPMGPFELRDFDGNDVYYLSFGEMQRREPTRHMCPLYEDMYKKGEFGVKTGKGFYTYPAPGKYVKPDVPESKADKVDPVVIIAEAINDAAALVRKDVITKEDVDKAARLGFNYPKGFFQYADEFGIDRVIKTLRMLRTEFGFEEYEPDPLLLDLEKQGSLGKKTGRGFYDY